MGFMHMWAAFNETGPLGTRALYSLLFQNLVYVNIVYSALYELSDGNPTKYPFELFLFVFMVASIVSGME